jgi:hypothetical protein
MTEKTVEMTKRAVEMTDKMVEAKERAVEITVVSRKVNGRPKQIMQPGRATC